ncbi:MAG TPA: hypothetical protein VLL74_06725 [Methanoregula sp.]|nr:hypothetical protein [Methanoregula sp.]
MVSRKKETLNMTTRDDILKQVETTLRDTCYPPTLKEKEILRAILYNLSAGPADFIKYNRLDTIRSA